MVPAPRESRPHEVHHSERCNEPSSDRNKTLADNTAENKDSKTGEHRRQAAVHIRLEHGTNYPLNVRRQRHPCVLTHAITCAPRAGAAFAPQLQRP
jgi:hypothetical protein